MGKSTNIDDKKLLDFVGAGTRQVEIAKYFNCGVRTIQARMAKLRISEDAEIVKTNVQLAKAKQRYQDLNRIERKSFREQARFDNALLEYTKALTKVITENSLPTALNKSFKSYIKNGKATGVIHITDAHLNELVNLNMNRYDFTIASQRFRFFALQLKDYFKMKKINNVLIAVTGDMLNSDRRMDELLSEATNRSKATFLAIAIIEQFIMDVAQDFHVTIASVIGNESRVGKDVGWEESVASDNYDFTIFHILKLIFRKTKIKFLSGDSVEQVISVSGQNILLIHGNQLKANQVEQSIQKIKGKYTAKGIHVDFVIFGHLHSTRIGDTYARGASIVGANAYSDSALQLESRASQNLHIFYDNGTRDSIKIDLQNVKGIEGYPIKNELEAYNAKSLKKAMKKVSVQRVV